MISNSASSGIAASPFKSFSNCTNKSINLAAKTPEVVLKANPDRLYAAFINNSSIDIWLVLSPPAKANIGQGIPLKAMGGSFEINQTNLYIGTVTAIALANCNLSFVECVE